MIYKKPVEAGDLFASLPDVWQDWQKFLKLPEIDKYYLTLEELHTAELKDNKGFIAAGGNHCRHQRTETYYPVGVHRRHREGAQAARRGAQQDSYQVLSQATGTDSVLPQAPCLDVDILDHQHNDANEPRYHQSLLQHAGNHCPQPISAVVLLSLIVKHVFQPTETSAILPRQGRNERLDVEEWRTVNYVDAGDIERRTVNCVEAHH